MATICQARLNQVWLPCWGEVVLQKVLIKVGRCLKMLQISCVPMVSRILQVAREGKKKKTFLNSAYLSARICWPHHIHSATIIRVGRVEVLQQITMEAGATEIKQFLFLL